MFMGGLRVGISGQRAVCSGCLTEDLRPGCGSGGAVKHWPAAAGACAIYQAFCKAEGPGRLLYLYAGGNGCM